MAHMEALLQKTAQILDQFLAWLSALLRPAGVDNDFGVYREVTQAFKSLDQGFLQMLQRMGGIHAYPEAVAYTFDSYRKVFVCVHKCVRSVCKIRKIPATFGSLRVSACRRPAKRRKRPEPRVLGYPPMAVSGISTTAPLVAAMASSLPMV